MKLCFVVEILGFFIIYICGECYNSHEIRLCSFRNIRKTLNVITLKYNTPGYLILTLKLFVSLSMHPPVSIHSWCSNSSCPQVLPFIFTAELTNDETNV